MHGSLKAEDEVRPQCVDGLSITNWAPEIGSAARHPLRSAYAEFLGREVDFTNYTWINDEPEAFMETLDYVLVSRGTRVLNVRLLPQVYKGDPVFPNSKEPSDHVMLAANLQFG